MVLSGKKDGQAICGNCFFIASQSIERTISESQPKNDGFVETEKRTKFTRTHKTRYMLAARRESVNNQPTSTKIWYQAQRQGSNFLREEITKLTLRVFALRRYLPIRLRSQLFARSPFVVTFRLHCEADVSSVSPSLERMSCVLSKGLRRLRCGKGGLKLGTLINLFDTKFVFHFPNDTAPEFLWELTIELTNTTDSNVTEIAL